MARAQKSIAEAEGYTHLDDQDLLHITGKRIRQLEAELATHRLVIGELSEAHPNEDAGQVEESIASLEKRLPLLRDRYETLRAHLAAQAPPPEAAPGAS